MKNKIQIVSGYLVAIGSFLLILVMGFENPVWAATKVHFFFHNDTGETLSLLKDEFEAAGRWKVPPPKLLAVDASPYAEARRKTDLGSEQTFWIEVIYGVKDKPEDACKLLLHRNQNRLGEWHHIVIDTWECSGSLKASPHPRVNWGHSQVYVYYEKRK